MHAVLDKQGLSYDWDSFSETGRYELVTIELAPINRTVLDSFLSVIDSLTEEIEALGQLIEETAVAREETQRLMTIPGVSFYSSVLIAGEISVIERFNRHEELVSYAELDPETCVW